jgi:RNA-binding protein
MNSPMPLSPAKKKHYRTIAHNLKPVLIIADKGVTEGVELELERALEDHELIKVKVNINDGKARKQIATQLCESHKATLVQQIGKMIVLVRAAKKPNPKLSNLLKPA